MNPHVIAKTKQTNCEKNVTVLENQEFKKSIHKNCNIWQYCVIVFKFHSNDVFDTISIRPG